MIGLGRIMAVLPLAVALAVTATAQETDTSPVQTNLDLIRVAAHQVGDSVAHVLTGGDSNDVAVTVLPRDMAWIVEGALLEGLKTSGRSLRAGGDGSIVVEFGFAGARVEYSDVRRQGLFGSRVLDRKVTVHISGKVTETRKGNVLLAKDFVQEHSDVINLDDVQRVESSTLPMTRGTVPSEGFFSNIAEPLVMIGALAVAVYLLFAVRS